MKHSRHTRHRPGEADRSVAVVLVAKHAGESDDSVGTHALDSNTDFVRITFAKEPGRFEVLFDGHANGDRVAPRRLIRLWLGTRRPGDWGRRRWRLRPRDWGRRRHRVAGWALKGPLGDVRRGKPRTRVERESHSPGGEQHDTADDRG